MLMLAEKQLSVNGEHAARFWIDPEVEVTLTAQINELFPGLSEPVGSLSNSQVHQQSLPLMDCYNRDNPDCMPDLPSALLSAHRNGGDAA